MWRQLIRGLRVLGRRKAADRDVADEVSHYLDEPTAAHIQRGLAPDEALRAARLELGGATSIREQVRSYGWENIADNLFADLRYAVRRLAGDPGFTAVCILTLAMGIGAATAIFSVVDAVLLRTLPYPHPEELVRVWEQAPNGRRMNIADPNLADFQGQNSTFQAVTDYSYLLSSVSGGSEPVRINIAVVSAGFFETLGIPPERGRIFDAGEQRPHGSTAAVVSHRYWQRYLNSSDDLSAFTLRMEGGAYPVVGVMPEGFDFPSDATAWIPRQTFPDSPNRRSHNLRGIGRLRDGVTVAQARADLSAIARRIKSQYGKGADLSDAVVLPLSEVIVGDVRTALLTLLAAVGLLLLVACTNVAGLLLARTSARRKELAVRAALGAGRVRLVQQFLVESFVLSAAGGAAGVAFSIWAIRALPAILPSNLPRQQNLTINAPVLLFALTAIVAVAVSLGLFAAWRAAHGDLQEALMSGSRTYSGGPSQRLRGFLVIGEIATTLVILVGAGLLGRSFLRLISTNPGFRTENLITMEFSPPNPRGQAFAMEAADVARQVRLMEDILTRLRAIPSVEQVGLAGALPVAAGDDLADGDFLILNGQGAPANFDEYARVAQNPERVGHAAYCVAGAAYFRTLGIPLLRGRMFADQDDWDLPHAALISQSLARQRWPNQDPIGQIIEFGNMDGNLKPLVIVGIVGDVRGRGLDAPPSPIIYVNYRQRGMNANSSPTILMRSTAPVGEIAAVARGVFHELAPEAPVKFSTFADEMGGWLAERRFLLLLVGAFGAAALGLATIGIYGVVAFSVARRTQEIGVRMALGAQKVAVLRLIVGEGARLAAIGVTIGIAAAFAVTRLLASLLFGVSTTDPITFAAVAAILSAVALLAAYLPARRAMRLDATVALRYE